MKALILSVLLILTSCAQQQVSQRKAQLEAELNPLMGQSEESVLLSLGRPGAIEEVNGIKIYRYKRSYGTRSTASASAYGNPYSVNAYGSGQSWESYDEYNVYFQNGTAVKWDGYVQR